MSDGLLHVPAEFCRNAEQRIRERGPVQRAPFRDVDPDHPLLYALYSREHALELIEGTGWKVESVSPPDIHLQHHIICAPA